MVNRPIDFGIHFPCDVCYSDSMEHDGEINYCPECKKSGATCAVDYKSLSMPRSLLN